MMSMHYANVMHKTTQPGRLFRLLKRRPGRWKDSWTLAREVQTTAISTVVSAVRLQLAQRPEIGFAVERRSERCDDGRWKNWYRVIKVKR